MEYKTGVIIGGVFKDGEMISGTIYTAEEWAQKHRDDQMKRMEEKLDAIMKHLGIAAPPQS